LQAASARAESAGESRTLETRVSGSPIGWPTDRSRIWPP
jgi:hypothetical protein